MNKNIIHYIAVLTCICCITNNGISQNNSISTGNLAITKNANQDNANQHNIGSLQYWFDDGIEEAINITYTETEFTIAAYNLPRGIHTLNYRVRDINNRWSALRSHIFFRRFSDETSRIVSYAYWWNDLVDKVTTKQLESPTEVLVIDEEMTILDEARNSYADHYTATLNIVITDNHGRSIYHSSNVTYPDNDTPVTDIDADKYVTTSTVKLMWTETSNDKMGDYNVYYSKDNGPFILWLPDTKLTSATFNGERGSMYKFTVTGRDSFGNREKFDKTKCVSVTFE